MDLLIKRNRISRFFFNNLVLFYNVNLVCLVVEIDKLGNKLKIED